jgi:putative ABC transport system permease protein
MNPAVIPISYGQLAFSLSLLIIVGAISAMLRLGLLRPLVWGAFRTFVQLTLIGFALHFLFELKHLGLVLGMVTFMVAVATHAAVGRAPSAKGFPPLYAFLAMWAGTVLSGVIVLVLVIRPDPWYTPRIAIPIFGMILGNSINTVSLALETLYSGVRTERERVEALLSMGATPWEAVRSNIRKAMKTGMTPILNSLSVVGLVSLPGMMTGQILGGAEPDMAVRYQILVMYMIAAAVATGCLILVTLSYRRLFTENLVLRPELRQSGDSPE